MKIYKEAIVPYSAEAMFRLVDDIPSYPQFLPWCQQAHEHHRTTQEVTASLQMARVGIHKQFTTKNTLTPYSLIHIALVEGPFHTLQGEWRFIPLSDTGSKITLQLQYETTGKWFDVAFASVFDRIANSLVDAFCARARQLYANHY